MKKIVMGLVAALLLAAGCMSSGSAPVQAAGMDLDAAIKEGAVQTETKIPEGTKIALVSVASSSARLSEYVINTLEAALVSGGKLVVVDRANLDKIRAEQGFQLSGEVDDESATSIGKLLGAGAIVTGAFTDLGDVYRLNLKAIDIQTATIAVSYPADIAKSARIENLLVSGGGGAAGTAAASGGQAAAQAKPAVPAGPKDGTYTFYPRLRPYKGASLEENVYIHKIVVRGEYMNIYLCRNAEGSTKEGPSESGNWGGYFRADRMVLQSLDNPALSYNPETRGTMNIYANNNDNTGHWFTFKGVKFTRFRLTSNYDTPSVFEEIVLGEPDA